MDFDAHYVAIKTYYGPQCAKRSGVPYMQHIDEGLRVLDALGASLPAKRAFCLHPIVQADEDLSVAFAENSILRQHRVDAYALMLATEYRAVANEYLSRRAIGSISEIRLSPLREVNEMLIADKVQNRKDFERHHARTHARAPELAQYFAHWLRRLEISEERYRALAAIASGTVESIR